MFDHLDPKKKREWIWTRRILVAGGVILAIERLLRYGWDWWYGTVLIICLAGLLIELHDIMRRRS
jgi:hypothetical protein